MSEIKKAYQDYSKNKKLRKKNRAKLFKATVGRNIPRNELNLMWKNIDKVKESL